MRALAQNFVGDKIALLAVLNHLATTDTSERTERRHKINRLEDVRFSLCIVAQQQMKSRREVDVESRVISKVAKFEMCQMQRLKIKKPAATGEQKPAKAIEACEMLRC